MDLQQSCQQSAAYWTPLARWTSPAGTTLLAFDVTAATGVVVVTEYEHTCMSIRGIRKTGAHTMTSAVRETIRTDPRTRDEALELLRNAAPRR